MASGDFSAVALEGATAAEAASQRATAFEALSDWAPRVAAGRVSSDDRDESLASVELSFRWDLEINGAAGSWDYTTSTQLARIDGQWRAHWSPTLLAPDLTEDEYLTVRRVQGRRADVLGAHDTTLVTYRPVHRLGVDKTLIDPSGWDTAARSFASAVSLDEDAYAARVAAAGDRAFVEALTVREEDPEHDVNALTAIPGVRAIADDVPLAPTRTFARPILGTVGPATAEIVEQSDGTVTAGDLTGLGGLQKQFDEQLRGEPGLAVIARAASDGAHRELFRVEPASGQPLRTTLMLEMQRAAETVVSDVTDSASAVVAVRPSTGEILAAASGPGGDGTSTATLGMFPPGSTFKVASSLALLRSGLTPESTLSCPSTTTVDGRDFRNYPSYPVSALGEISLRTVIAESCNTALINAADRAPQEALAAAGEALGLSADVDLGFAAALGKVPAEADGRTDHAASMIGQARVQATPLGMATVAASVAAGHRVTPVLLPDAEVSTPEPAQPLTQTEADALRSMMRAVVTEGGGAFLSDIPGAEVIAKSGTAQYGTGENLLNHAWMIAAQGDLAVAVFVETGDYGSTTSGPLLESFLRSAAWIETDS
ncbi:penicillin-binding transpeptidase domain-containing protein [Cellulosimicrobium cellulans]|uniref:penicillin-binding transpeptidase domain-containing protein n=1 Tax=Cellulosimicrobium cellulans TaxID=1710 RepID=UPI0021CB0D87|nr:penicillin-binding transpeptidase domain-containing protein [Cellulosimicrobium cellulans]